MERVLAGGSKQFLGNKKSTLVQKNTTVGAPRIVLVKKDMPKAFRTNKGIGGDYLHLDFNSPNSSLAPLSACRYLCGSLKWD